jgi:hypothetical protein
VSRRRPALLARVTERLLGWAIGRPGGPVGTGARTDPWVLTSIGERTAAWKHLSYLRYYDEWFRSLVDTDVSLLELGVYQGGSLLMWRDYFRRGVIVGLDAEPVALEDRSGRVRLYRGMQQDTALLDRIRREAAPGGFDIIIDDCSHLAEFARISYRHLFDHHLKPGGIYVIEDWVTGYWEHWPDGETVTGPNHGAGMVGLVKEVIDECGKQEDHTTPPAIQRIQITPGQVFIVKATGRSVVQASPWPRNMRANAAGGEALAVAAGDDDPAGAGGRLRSMEPGAGSSERQAHALRAAGSLLGRLARRGTNRLGQALGQPGWLGRRRRRASM